MKYGSVFVVSPDEGPKGADEAGLLQRHARFELQDPKGGEAFFDMFGIGENVGF